MENKDQKDYSKYDLDTMPPDVWRGMTEEERREWTQGWLNKGCVAFGCIRCGYPVSHPELTVGGCEACEEEGERR